MAAVLTLEQLAIIKAAWERFGQHLTLREYTQRWLHLRQSVNTR